MRPASAAPVAAGWWQRFGAYVLDSIVVTVPFTVAYAVWVVPLWLDVVGRYPYRPRMTRRELERLMELQTEALTARMLENASDMYLAFVVLGLALPLLYFTLFHAWRGQTPGKMAVGIRVVRETGERLGFGHALARYVVQAVLWWLLWLPGLVDSLWPLRDERKQSLHDKAAGTLVVRA